MTTEVTSITASPTAHSGPSRPARGGSPHEFLRLIEGLGRRVNTQDPAVVQGAAVQLASELFFAPLLAEMRRFPLGRDLATGGQTESIFGEQLDQRIADEVAAADHTLVNHLAKQLQEHSGRPNRPAAENAPVGTEVNQS